MYLPILLVAAHNHSKLPLVISYIKRVNCSFGQGWTWQLPDQLQVWPPGLARPPPWALQFVNPPWDFNHTGHAQLLQISGSAVVMSSDPSLASCTRSVACCCSSMICSTWGIASSTVGTSSCCSCLWLVTNSTYAVVAIGKGTCMSIGSPSCSNCNQRPLTLAVP